MDKTMYDPEAWVTRGASRAVSINRIYNFVYGWMTVGLVVSGLVAWFAATRIPLQTLGRLMIPATIVEIGLVLLLSLGFRKLAPMAVLLAFLAFSAINGLTLSVYFLVYSIGTLQTVFFITAGTFAGMALFGTLTKMNLSGIGGLCGMALWGIVIASVVNFFLGSSGLDAAISYIGVLVFVGLTAWDAQKIRMLAESEGMLDAPMTRKLGILCALQLYLDFINLFIFLLRILGDRNRE